MVSQFSKHISRQIIITVILLALGQAEAFSFETSSSAIFRDDVKTLQVRNPDFFMSPTVIRLGTRDVLHVNFDILGDQHEYLRYKLIHCNADWKPSRLMESEYVEGFNEAEVTDYAYSSNTYIHYVNYNIEIPNSELPILASGNYLLQVYPENDPDDILLQARFSVSENITGVGGVVTSRTDKGFNSEYQQLMLSVDAPGNINPYQDLIITVEQNNRPETLRSLTHPMRVDGNKVIFDHDMNLIFEAGNEYRRFETVRTDYPGMHVDSVMFGGNNWHAWLKEDSMRNDREYVYDSTQHGRFKIDEYNSTDPDLGADYVTVHFTLDAPQISGADIFIDGDFVLNHYDRLNKMTYDFNDGLYHGFMPLKQGSYNYQYVVVPHSTGIPEPAPIEGNKYETQNEYIVKVFLRTPGSRGDRLIGTTVL